MSRGDIIDIETISDPCKRCGSDNLRISDDYFLVCVECGLVESTFRAMSLTKPHDVDDYAFANYCGDYQDSYKENQFSVDIWDDTRPNAAPPKNIKWKRITDDVDGKGRYKPVFHWNERLVQMRISDPEISWKTLYRIGLFAHARHKTYGKPENYTRGTIYMILRDMKLNQRKERWKTILRYLDKWRRMKIPTLRFIFELEPLYTAFEQRFLDYKNTMPKSHIRKNGNVVVVKERHNVVPFNYLFRKFCEAKGHRDFHDELPLLRSNIKIQALDNITEPIFEEMGLEFHPTPLLKMPKIKKNTK